MRLLQHRYPALMTIVYTPDRGAGMKSDDTGSAIRGMAAPLMPYRVMPGSGRYKSCPARAENVYSSTLPGTSIVPAPVALAAPTLSLVTLTGCAGSRYVPGAVTANGTAAGRSEIWNEYVPLLPSLAYMATV